MLGGTDLPQLQKYFGSSNEFINSLTQKYTSGASSDDWNALLEQAQLLASCKFEIGTKWGQEVSRLYNSAITSKFTETKSICIFLNCFRLVSSMIV